ncbi:MAG: (deoxy)nucleoside triphosphate pyrophosphohydrolase, partial [Thermodesulfobacteriota bacterium]
MKTSASFPDPKRIRRALTGWYDRHRRKPDCPVCPLQDDCRARVQGLAHRLPVRGKKKSIPHREVVSAVIRDGNGRLLIVQRPARGLLGSLWKFPGGILNPEEPPEEGLVRIARKELGLDIGVGSPLAAVKHAYSHFRITLTAFSCTLREGIPTGSPWQWAGTGELEELPFSKADRLIARSIAPA